MTKLIPLGRTAKELTEALTRANAATAAAFEVAARAINDRGAVEQENFGLGRATQNFFRARDIVRALATPDQTAALDQLIAEAVGPLINAADAMLDAFCVHEDSAQIAASAGMMNAIHALTHEVHKS